MRIAYISPYQGPSLRQRRPIIGNLALAANVKMEVIAELLRRRDHDVHIFSQGEVDRFLLKFFPGFAETEPFDERVPIHYASTLPIRYINGTWSSQRLLSLFRAEHRRRPFDLVIIYNLKRPQIVCAQYASRHLGLPVVLEYEDDIFVDVGGRPELGFRARRGQTAARDAFGLISGGIGVSPYLLSQMPDSIPKVLLRGVVDDGVLDASRRPFEMRPKRIVFSGTHFRSKGLEPLIAAWKLVQLPGWELHIAGRGELTAKIEKMAEGSPTIVFHGLLDRKENARLLGQARIGINPHDVSETPGNVFAFKIVEYLAAGAHCITTPMGPLEPELEAGITYIPDNSPQTIASTLTRVIRGGEYERRAAEAAHDRYGPDAVSKALERLLGGLLRPSAAEIMRGNQ